MGRSTTTKLVDDKDSIVMYTRDGGYPEDTEWYIKNSVSLWRKNIELLRTIQKKKGNIGTYRFTTWINDMEALLNDYEKTGRVDIAAVLLASIKINGYRPVPESGDNQEILDELGSAECFECQFDLAKQCFTETAHKVTASSSLLDYSFGEITDDEEGNTKTRFKFKDISKEELQTKLFLLPFFIRDFFMFSREIIYIEKESEENLSLRRNFAMNFSYNTLSSFYRQTDKADRTDRKGLIKKLNRTSIYDFEETQKKAGSEEEKLDDVENIIFTIENKMIFPIDISGGSLIALLSLMLPGKVFPLTESEKGHSPESVCKIKILEGGEINLECENPQELKEYIDMDVYAYRNSIEVEYGLKEFAQDYYHLKENHIYFNLLESIAKAMYNQRTIEILR